LENINAELTHNAQKLEKLNAVQMLEFRKENERSSEVIFKTDMAEKQQELQNYKQKFKMLTAQRDKHVQDDKRV